MAKQTRKPWNKDRGGHLTPPHHCALLCCNCVALFRRFSGFDFLVLFVCLFAMWKETKKKDKNSGKKAPLASILLPVCTSRYHYHYQY
mmetsp:Transcript_17381/g.36337  ORF Transcript_17381/g.36337 Transcript_17381/m.36337 type:complete len:88 (+) Transcript_17381:388-651(+)